LRTTTSAFLFIFCSVNIFSINTACHIINGEYKRRVNEIRTNIYALQRTSQYVFSCLFCSFLCHLFTNKYIDACTLCRVCFFFCLLFFHTKLLGCSFFLSFFCSLVMNYYPIIIVYLFHHFAVFQWALPLMPFIFI